MFDPSIQYQRHDWPLKLLILGENFQTQLTAFARVVISFNTFFSLDEAKTNRRPIYQNDTYFLFKWVRHQQKTNRWLVKVIIFHYMSPNLNAMKIFSLITIAIFEASGFHIVKILEWYVYVGATHVLNEVPYSDNNFDDDNWLYNFTHKLRFDSCWSPNFCLSTEYVSCCRYW